MKKHVFILFWMGWAIHAGAQINNPGFEELNPDNQAKYWGKTYLFSVVIDSTGEWGDSVVIDQALYAVTTDAHSGTYAMEMRNGHNYITQEDIVGSVILSENESGYPGFNTPPVLDQRPQSFAFYYKFFPANTDSAYAYLGVYDEPGNLIGEAQAQLGGTTATYTLAEAPVLYTSTAPAAYMAMYFSAAKPGTPGSLGSRFLVDDVSLVGSSGIQNITNTQAGVHVYPNPATGPVTFTADEPLPASARITLTDAGGKIVYTGMYSQPVSVEPLPAGLYFWTLDYGNIHNRGKLLKQ